ncbi:DUF4271 domain-containing protein [Flavobacteriaceae bacterium]|nr:DUF4271 domain-containing protein [Flavobacteriaceae bacterium]MDC1492034.1 DUF4271 domain-containing protein [Flavobacteriaceae bacterium]
MLRDYILFDGFTIIILINIILVAITKTLNSLKFKHFLLIYLNNSFLKFNSNDNNYLSNFNVLLNINYIVSISVFICVIFSYNSYSPSNIFEISEFLKILFFLTVFIYCKYLVELIVGWAFSINKFIATINLQKNSFNQLMGVVVILLNTLAIYSFPNSLTFIKISLFIVISLYLIGIYKVITLNDNLILSNMFYFILYLCTLEIVPILFIINELI